MIDEKPIYIWPGENPLLDGSRPVIYLGSAIGLGFIGLCFGIFFSFFLLWSNIPLLPIPDSQSAMYHFKGFIASLLSFVLPNLQYDFLSSYASTLWKIKAQDLLHLIYIRWIATLIIGIGFGTWMFMISLKPSSNFKQVRGKKLLKNKEAYDDLFREYSSLESSGIIIGRNDGFDPSNPNSYINKPKDLIELPEDKRRTHFIYIGGTGRGKTHTIYTHQLVPIYHYIRSGIYPYKLFIVDTPKSDYSKFFHKKHIFKIAPHEKGSVCWDLAVDIRDGLVAAAFWEGIIPSNDKDQTWTNSSRLVGTGTTKTLQELAPKLWNYGMQAYMLGKTPEQLKLLLDKYYPEAKQVLSASEATITSVMFNLGTFSSSFIQLARIYDGFDIKQSICQATANALKLPDFLEFISDEMMFHQDLPGLEDVEKASRAVYFKAAVHYLNRSNPEWKWQDFASYIKKTSIEEQKKNAVRYCRSMDLEFLNTTKIKGWESLSSSILTYAKKWDEYESKPKISLRNWIKNENPERKIFVLKPSEIYPTLTEGLIRGMLFFANSVILGEVPDDKNRKFSILIDELQSNGNIDPFLGPALALYRSKGISLTLAFQDLSQLDKLYGEEFVKFLNSNIGNIFLMGVNQGTTAEALSDLVGKMDFLKLHVSQSIQEGGKSSSLNWQEHSRQVISADEINTLLGLKRDKGEIHYLYLAGGLNPAYILKNKLNNYKVRNTPELAEWIDNPKDEVRQQAISYDSSPEVEEVPSIEPPKDADEVIEYLEQSVDSLEAELIEQNQAESKRKTKNNVDDDYFKRMIEEGKRSTE